MKRTMISISLLFCGIIVGLTILGYGLEYSQSLTEWYSDDGKLWTFIGDNRLLIPLYCSIIISLIAIVMLFIEYFSKKN